jgi:hypothetical protein
MSEIINRSVIMSNVVVNLELPFMAMEKLESEILTVMYSKQRAFEDALDKKTSK